MNEGENGIEDLPDAILQQILFCLPTRDAVRSSVLSRKWRYLWCSVPKLHLSNEIGENRKIFTDFVERALLLRSSDIKIFSLSFNVLSDALRVNSWIFSAIKHNVQELHLCLDTNAEPFVLPDCLFRCKSLRVLELSMIHYMKLPSFISLSSLNELTLKFILFPDENSTQKLFSGCPQLEYLMLYACDWANVGGVCVIATKLKTLAVIDFPNEHNVDGCQIVFVAPSLKSLTFVGCLVDDYVFYDSNSLVEVKFGLLKNGRLTSYHAHKLIQGLSSVKELTLSVPAVRVLGEVMELLKHLPVFHALTYLEFEIDPLDFASRIFWNILRNSPCLAKLELKKGVYLSKLDCGNDDWTLDPMPSCFSKHLRTVGIYNFLGTEEELHVARHLLKNALVLEKMVISCAEALTSMKKHNARQELLRLHKSSNGCEVVIM